MIDLSKIDEARIQAEIGALLADADGDSFTAELLAALWTQLCHARRQPEPSRITAIRWEAEAARACLRGQQVTIGRSQEEMTGPLGKPDVPDAMRHLDAVLAYAKHSPPVQPLTAFPAITPGFLGSLRAENEPADRGLYMMVEDGGRRPRSLLMCNLGQLKQLAEIAMQRLAGATLACDDLDAAQEADHGGRQIEAKVKAVAEECRAMEETGAMKSYAPWTDDLVANLTAYQTAGNMHPFTCPNRGDGKHPEVNGDRGVLRPTREGWRCDHCDYTQHWAYDFMLNAAIGSKP